MFSNHLLKQTQKTKPHFWYLLIPWYKSSQHGWFQASTQPQLAYKINENFNSQLSGKTCEGPAILLDWQVNKLACHGDGNSLRVLSSDQVQDEWTLWIKISWNAIDLLVVVNLPFCIRTGSRVNNYLNYHFWFILNLSLPFGPLQLFLSNSSLKSFGTLSQFITIRCHFLKEDFLEYCLK